MLRLILPRTSLTTRTLQTSITMSLATTASPGSKKPINLLAGWPNPKLLPPQSLATAADSVCNDPSISASALGYGADGGYKPLRESIASWLTDFYQRDPAITFDQICITGGASQNLACILQVFSDPIYTRNIWLVSPTYFHACKICDDAGFAGRLRAVPEDAEGIDLDYLAAAIEASEAKALQDGNTEPKLKSARPYRKIYKHVIYAVPTFANPSGGVMSLARREGLVRLARKYDALAVTDDVYDMLQWPVSLGDAELPQQPSQTGALNHACLPRLVDIDATLDGGPVTEFGNTVSNGTFSKIVAPGCRTGWAQGTSKMALGVGKVGSTQSGGAPSQFTSTFMHQLLTTSTLQNHIRNTLQPAYSRRYHSMLDAMKTRLLPLGCKLISKPAQTPSTNSTNSTSSTPSTNISPQSTKSQTGIGGGYFHYLTLPPTLTLPTSNTTAETIADHIQIVALEQENLKVMAGSRFRVDGDVTELDNKRYESDIRLSFAWADEDDIAEGVRRLASVIERELKLQSTPAV